jgi:hypothetical protein
VSELREVLTKERDFITLSERRLFRVLIRKVSVIENQLQELELRVKKLESN